MRECFHAISRSSQWGATVVRKNSKRLIISFRVRNGRANTHQRFRSRINNYFGFRFHLCHRWMLTLPNYRFIVTSSKHRWYVRLDCFFILSLYLSVGCARVRHSLRVPCDNCSLQSPNRAIDCRSSDAHTPFSVTQIERTNTHFYRMEHACVWLVTGWRARTLSCVNNAHR